MSETVPTASYGGGGEALASVLCEQAGPTKVEKRKLSYRARRGRRAEGQEGKDWSQQHQEWLGPRGPELGIQQRPREQGKRPELGQRGQELLTPKQGVCGAPLRGASGKA